MKFLSGCGVSTQAMEVIDEICRCDIYPLVRILLWFHLDLAAW